MSKDKDEEYFRDYVLGKKSEEEVAAEKASDVEMEQLIKDCRSSLQHPYVQRMLWRFLEKAGILRTSFNNTGWTAFFEGRRDFSLYMMKCLEDADPEAMSKMRTTLSAARQHYLAPPKPKPEK